MQSLLLLFACLLADGQAGLAQRRVGFQADRPRRPARSARGRQIPRFRDTLKVGDKAPDFELKTVDGKQTVRLSSFQGKRPVLLIFGSYT